MRVVWSLLLVLGAAGISLAAEPMLLVPRNSFIVRPVASARELAHQIRTEPVVAQRYARHFGRDAWEFAEYVEKNLRLSQLQQAQTFNVYYAPPDNRLMVVRRTLPKGTPVFVDKRTGKPVLKANCGNPLTPAVSLPQTQAQAVPTPTVVAQATPVMSERLTEAEMPMVEVVEIAEAPIEEAVAADVLPVETLVETLPESAPEPEAIVTPIASPATPELPPLISRGPNLLPFLPLLTLLTPRGGGDYEPIPEPSSLLMLGSGLGLLYPLARRAFKRSQNSSQRTGDSNTLSA